MWYIKLKVNLKRLLLTRYYKNNQKHFIFWSSRIYVSTKTNKASNFLDVVQSRNCNILYAMRHHTIYEAIINGHDPERPHCMIMWYGHDRYFLEAFKTICNQKSVNNAPQQHIRWTESLFSLCTNPQRRVRVRILEVQVVFPIFAELWRSNVHSNINLARITSFLNCLFQQLQTYNVINSNILRALYFLFKITAKPKSLL